MNQPDPQLWLGACGDNSCIELQRNDETGLYWLRATETDPTEWVFVTSGELSRFITAAKAGEFDQLLSDS